MADNTLSSRLRVLIAKTFRAEKLYSTMRAADTPLFDTFALAEAANNLRASVWQTRHHQLRKALNEILSESRPADVAFEVAKVRDGFEARASESRELIERNRRTLIDSAQRDEFAHTLKLSGELVRAKAELQANQIIADELSSLLQGSKRKTQRADNIVGVEVKRENRRFEPAEHSEEQKPSNVVPFRRRAVAGRESR